jgi:peptidoglycan/xylan/chitin deacetylase (PgdA/CDA1 family)
VPIALTFDDDLQSHVALVAPLLGEYGLSATFFLWGDEQAVTNAYWWEAVQVAVDRGTDLPPPLANHRDPDGIGAAMLSLTGEHRDTLTAALWDQMRLKPPKHLDAHDLATIVALGAKIGFHTWGHRVLTTCDDSELRHNLSDGLARLRELSGQEIAAVAYPYGIADERVASHARRAGFRIGATTQPTAVIAGSDPLLLGRIEPSFVSLGDHALRLVGVLLRGTSVR